MRRLSALLCLALCLLSAPGRVHAHAQLVAADPAAGALVASPPGDVLLSFSEPVTLLRLRWFGPDGTTEETAARVEGRVLRVAVPASVQPGTQSVTWRIVSLDGHPVGGTHVFSIGVRSAVAGGGGAAPGAMPGGAAAGPAAAARLALTLSLVFGVGGLLWAAIAGLPAGRPARLAACAAGPAALLALGAHGLDLADAGPAALLTAAPWRLALDSPLCATAILAVLAGGIAAAGAGRRPLLLIAWGLAAASFAVSGHAASAAPRPWMAVAVAIHAAAMLFWIGALPGLAAALKAGADAGLLRRFSRLATPLVAALAASGAALAWVQLGGAAEALWQTGYGRVLTAKLVLAALLLALAAVNRLVLTPALAAGDPAARRRLGRSVRAEIALGLAILAAAALFRLTPPPRALAAAAAAAPVHRHLHSVAAMADVALEPGRPGLNRLALDLFDGTGRPLLPQELGVSFAQPATGLGPIAAAARREASGPWVAEVYLPQAGTWTVEVDILIDDFRREFLVGTVPVRP